MRSATAGSTHGLPCRSTTHACEKLRSKLSHTENKPQGRRVVPCEVRCSQAAGLNLRQVRQAAQIGLQATVMGTREKKGNTHKVIQCIGVTWGVC